MPVDTSFNVAGPSNIEVRNNNNRIGGDNKFFHITCHIDQSMRSKIEQGDFVDLEKLLPRDSRKHGDENRM